MAPNFESGDWQGSGNHHWLLNPEKKERKPWESMRLPNHRYFVATTVNAKHRGPRGRALFPR